MICRGLQCPNKKQCKKWIKNNENLLKEDKIINKCLNSKEFVKNG